MMPFTPLYSLPVTERFLDGAEKRYILRIRDLPREEKPREKLLKYGPHVLSVAELLAVVLNVGTKKEEVMQMAHRLLHEYGSRALVDQKNPKVLQGTLGVPLTKSCQIVACFELGRRFFTPDGQRPEFLRTAKQVFDYLRDMRDLPKEHLRGLYLNSHFRLVHDEVVSIGSVSANIIHPREVFRPAVERGASAVILAHNHPSGIAEPSEADIEITRQLVNAGNLLGIALLDHVIVTSRGFMSVPAEYSQDI